MDEERVRQLFRQDLSAGTDAFREELLERCLDALHDEETGREVDDSELDMLAAAGDPFAQLSASSHENL